MSGFAAEWLALREPYDARARNPAIREAAIAAVSDFDPINIVDLGCGTGAMLRMLSPLLPARQSWRLVDNDLGLLARAADSARPERVKPAPLALDLARDLEAALDGAVDLVTTTALLDLVSEEWLNRLVTEIAARRLPLYATLSYNGQVTFDPPDRQDGAIIAAVNMHQRGNKGFGPALGPTAAATAVKRFEAIGYSVLHDTADWEFGPQDRDMQNELLAGWAGAAREIDASLLSEILGWLTRRRDLVAAGRSSMRVGHVDVFARPTAMRRAERSQSNSTSPSSR
jgi:SAM-dependent methyltransferase